MPKKKLLVNRKIVGLDKRKFRVGSRKSGVSAHDLSTEALLDLVATAPGRKARMARQVLRFRGVQVVTPAEQVDLTVEADLDGLIVEADLTVEAA